MFSLTHWFTIVFAASMLFTASASAATYYVDFADGDNAADGQSPDSAWQHVPGDENATGGPGDVELQPGDTVIFKGGVAYHGSLVIEASGTRDEPITFDANTAGDFGDGRAILDGGQVIDNWQRAESPDDVEGNPRWEEMFYADVDVDISPNFHGEFVVHRKAPRDRQAPWQRIILYDGERQLLPIAQLPKPSDAFYPDKPGDFERSPQPLDVREDEGVTILTDEENLTADDPNHYDGMFIGVHGGNNHVYFAQVQEYDPQAQQLVLPHFEPSTYGNQTRYAFYNSVRLISEPGEWAIKPLGDGRSRVYMLPEHLVDGRPDNIGFPVYGTGITIRSGASHLRIAGFLIQRYSGEGGGISIGRNAPRSRNIHIRECEIRFVSGHAGIGPHHSDEIVIERCYIHHNPGWTTAIFLNRVNDYIVRDNYLDKNSGSGIRHYECVDGLVQNNAIMDHFGMHASAINVYEGCANVLLEGNYIQNTATLNRNAENITFRNNVLDGMGRNVIFGIWRSGQTGGRDIINVSFINNTFVRGSDSGGSTAILGQRAGNPSSPRGLVIRDNILHGLAEDLPGEIENNIYTREVEDRFMSESSIVVTDLDELFMDPENGDFRRRPGGPMMDVGADIAPPSGPLGEKVGG
ncbi:MAG: right-handed parallel beta-helix repeat-containing protein [Phycisphaeraceae bacterium]